MNGSTQRPGDGDALRGLRPQDWLFHAHLYVWHVIVVRLSTRAASQCGEEGEGEEERSGTQRDAGGDQRSRGNRE